MTPKDSLSAAVDAQIARLAGPSKVNQSERAGRSPLEAATLEVAANLRQIAEDRAAEARAEADRRAALKAAREYQAGERGRQLVREWEARQAARQAMACDLTSPPAASHSDLPAASPASERAAAPFDAHAPQRRRKAFGVIFEAARGRPPSDAELDCMPSSPSASAETAVAVGGDAPPSLLIPHL